MSTKNIKIIKKIIVDTYYKIIAQTSIYQN